MNPPNPIEPAAPAPAPRRKYERTVGPKLKWLLYFIFGLVALLGANSAYLSTITYLEWQSKTSLQNFFYQYMFLGHLGMGLLLVVPLIVFGGIHIAKAYNRPNRRAVRVGYGLFAICLIVLFTGVALMRFEGFEIKDPRFRSISYWAHVITPLMAIWLYILHRLAGPKIKWKVGMGWAGAVAAFCAAMAFLHSHDPRKAHVMKPKDGDKYFHPSAARTAEGNFIPANVLMKDAYCLECHKDAYNGWFHSAHHFSSFNNPPYLFSVKETREVSMKRDGNVKAARWCAGCHDPVPFFSGAFDDPNFDLEKHPTSQAGITCTACHSITQVNSTRGNGDYIIEEPIHYPFVDSTNRMLMFLNRTLVKSKPEFHKKTFLKETHKTAEFCSTCHKVSIPVELTKYKDFLRGQNHYDTYLLSGVSGHGSRSFYYPDKAKPNCAGCHMPLQASGDFGAKFFDSTNQVLSIHDHFFPGGNTGVPHIRKQPEIVKREEDFLKGTLRVDILGIKEGGTVDSPLIAPLRPKVPALKRGKTYLIEAVVRTLKLGHPFTQGTVDSNEVWVEAKVTSAGQTIGRNGGLGAYREVDPWSHFINVYMLDREGNRIDRRNPQDIFTPLYNHQIPPGAGQAVHYSLTVPEDAQGSVTVEVRLNYRKFDTKYMQFVYGKTFTNDLPIVAIAADKLTFPVEGATAAVQNPESTIPPWQRWNDYGIGLLLEGEKGSEKGELIQAAEAFSNVEKLGRADGPLNLARVYFKEGRLDEAVAALQRAAKSDPPGPRWTIAWLNGQVNKQNGFLDKAITEFRSILDDRSPELEKRGFDFSKDYEVINELGVTLYERAKQERANPARQKEFLDQAAGEFQKTLALDSENLTAHYNLALIYAQQGNKELADKHRAQHERFRPDDNARDVAVANARRANAAADHAAQAIVIYPLQRNGAPELPPRAAQPRSTAQAQ